LAGRESRYRSKFRRDDYEARRLKVTPSRAAFRYARGRHPFTIDAIVVLPNHLHAIWFLPDGEADFATRWRLIRTAFSSALPKAERISPSGIPLLLQAQTEYVCGSSKRIALVEGE
jgi:REP element-mobilizing transposase RayT